MSYELPAEVIYACVLGGSIAGSLAYFLMDRMVRIDSSVLRPLGIMAYFALFAAAKIGIEKIGFGFLIVIGLCTAFWGVAIALRKSSEGLLDRVTFFGGALLVAALSWVCLIPFFILLIVFAAVLGFRMPRQIDDDAALLIYVTSTLVSVFAAPILVRIFQVAMSMRPKPD